MGSAVHQLCVSFKLITQQLREKWAVITPFHSRLDRWNALSLLANCHHIQLPFAVYYFCILIKSNYRLEKYEKHECWAFFKNRRPFSPFCVDGFATRSITRHLTSAPCILKMAEALPAPQTASERFPRRLTIWFPLNNLHLGFAAVVCVLYLWFYPSWFHISQAVTKRKTLPPSSMS